MFFKFLYKKFKRIFSKEIIAIYVSHRTGNDSNSGFNKSKPKSSFVSACMAANACSPNKQKQIRMVYSLDREDRESIPFPHFVIYKKLTEDLSKELKEQYEKN